MYVYFAKAFDPDMVKIGRSKNPPARIADMQVGSPRRLLLYGTVKCESELDAMRIEKQAHVALSIDCEHGEWHHWTSRVERYVDALLNGPGGEYAMAAHVRFETPKPVEVRLPSDDEGTVSIPDAAAKYGIDVKKLRGYVWRNNLTDPIGCIKADRVYDDWRLQRLAN